MKCISARFRHLKSRELYYALRSLGFCINERQCQSFIDSEMRIAAGPAPHHTTSHAGAITNGAGGGGVNFSQFLDFIIDNQFNAKDYFDEILNGFDLFDFGSFFFLLKINIPKMFLKLFLFVLDQSGQISLDNLRRANQEAQLDLTETELKQMIQEVIYLLFY